jgi:hypothetical protein
VAPGAADAELGAETADECARFGPVLGCVVHAAPAGGAVGVFVHFASVNAAVAAVAAMHGRLFGGRPVAARLYDKARFGRGDLAF